jgi:hypothetical protein
MDMVGWKSRSLCSLKVPRPISVARFTHWHRESRASPLHKLYLLSVPSSVGTLYDIVTMCMLTKNLLYYYVVMLNQQNYLLFTSLSHDSLSVFLEKSSAMEATNYARGKKNTNPPFLFADPQLMECPQTCKNTSP